MTEESDPFCMLLSACRGFTAAVGMIVYMKKLFNSVFLLFGGLEMCYHTQ